ncbi:alpha/beta fold hydrolase [Tropicimonas sp. IMCC6043]|uniref:alpha/beta hydrolase n=1 Tax=Tropicimonas sp. IMCC6043 TaxID=2510645 RepID=UPI00101DC78C|nr:alpha/beta hydrolase [Tropicimonas sp. IMCC6043]RYH10629.1 alpha/beta hydrolase [Tropicimonas sp. IMCC6043]
MKSLYLEEHDAFVRWQAVGAGEEVLLCLPGLNVPAAWEFLDFACAVDLERHSAVLLDYIGSGDSDPSPWFPGSLESHVGVLVAVLEHLGGTPCRVIGHSFGGTVGIALALSRPDLVARLVVAEGNLTPGGGVASRKFAAMSLEEFEGGGLAGITDRLRAKAIAGDVRAAMLYGAWRLADPRALHANARALADLPLTFAHDFFALPMPRCFVFGESGYAAAQTAPQPDTPDPAWLRANGIDVRVVPGTGHGMVRESPAGFVAALAAAGVLER